ncbi:BA14K family protein [Rhizobium paknamense]|uniref:Lectin-like protein BA14k n=1 Tax=Rhizobium paknamense TaxID=1206817 RepID=A0ABU0IDQ0_9HYPH|nr:BA14K family protein [Rhizobium paknamense]MDQ0456377.1 hypothetical protein [Rhizobium paknamense]
MTRLIAIALSAATFLGSIIPAGATQSISTASSVQVQTQGVQVAENSWADDRRTRPRIYRHHDYRGSYYRDRDHRDRYYRDRYYRRHHHGNAGAIIGGFAAGAIIGGALASQPRYAPRYTGGNAHVSWCANRYRSYRAYDNTFQPYNGPRQQCISPYR